MNRLLLAAVMVLGLTAPVVAETYRVGDAIAAAVYYDDGADPPLGNTGLTVTLDCWRFSDAVQIVTAQAATEVGGGTYKYEIASGVVTTVGKYGCVFHSAGLADIVYARDVTTAAGNLDAAVTTRSDFDETADPVELIDSGGAAGTSAAELIVDAEASTLSTFDESATGVELADSGGAAGTSAAELVVDMAVPTANDNADQVWDEATAGHAGAGSTGLALTDIDTATGTAAPTAAVVADAVWDEAEADHVAAGSTGKVLTDLDTNVDVAVSTRNSTTPPTVVAIADQVWDEAIAGHLGAGGTGEALSNATAPSAATVADAVWVEALGDHSATGGSAAEALDNAGGVGTDPWTKIVPGAYDAGTAGATFGRIGSASISVTSPVNVAGDVTLVQGADEDQIDFDNDDGTWDDLTGSTVTFYAFQAKSDGTTFTKAMTVVTPTGSQKVRLAVVDTETDGLAPGVYQYQVWAVLSGAEEVVLGSGNTLVVKDLRP